MNPSGGSATQITHLNGDAVQPNWSPDGRKIVFEFDPADGSGCANVELMDPSGTITANLTTDPKICEGTPAFNRDGSRIYFEHFDPATGVDAIWSMNLQGTDRHLITAGTGTGVTASKISLDGTTLYFVDYNAEGHGALFTFSLTGSNLQQLTPFGLDAQTKVDWAPDGGHLEFSRDSSLPPPGLSPSIILIRPDGSQLHFLTHFNGGAVNAGGGTYPPDGNWIAFRFTDNGRYGLYKMHSDGSDMQPILPLSGMRPFNTDWGSAPPS